MKNKYSIVRFIVLMIMNVLFIKTLDAYEINQVNNSIEEIKLRVELEICIGSDKENEDLYNPFSIDIDNDGNIYILDSGNSRILVFNSKGKYLYKFGKEGQGPGELSRKATKIKILEDGNIYVIDNQAHKIIVYDKSGKYINMGKTAQTYYDDIVLNSGSYYMSSIYLRDNYEPIHWSKKLGESERTFGKIIEPSIGIVSELNSKFEHPEALQNYFALAGYWSYLTINSKKEIFHSQRFPYRIMKYNTEGHLLKAFEDNVEYETQQKYSVFVDGNYGGINRAQKIPTYFTPKINKDDSIMIPYMSPEKDYMYIDKMDSNLNIINRNIIPLKKEEWEKGDIIRQGIIDNDNNIYLLVIYENKSPKILKYRIKY